MSLFYGSDPVQIKYLPHNLQFLFYIRNIVVEEETKYTTNIRNQQ